MKNRLFLPLICLLLGGSSAIAAPSNDNFANAHLLSGDFDVHAGTTVAATRQGGEPAASDYSTVWYKWTPARGGRVRFSALPETSGYNYWRMTVWTGDSLGDLELIAFNEDSNGETRIEDLPVSPGIQYYICIGHEGSSSGNQEAFDMSVVLPTDSDLAPLNVTGSSAVNGTFSNALSLSGASDTAISYSRNFAEHEPGEPTRNPGYSSWYYYDASENGRINLSVAGTEKSQFYDYYLDKTIIVYNVATYAEMVNAAPVGTSYSTSGLPGTLSLNVVAGQRYYIAFGHGRYSGGSLSGTGDAWDTSWRVMTMSYSPLPPTVTTGAVNSVTTYSATVGGEVTSENGASVTERGVVFSTSWAPTTSSGTKVVSGSGMGSFTGNITGLSPSTTYYFRSYAINSEGTRYGMIGDFTTEPSTTVPTTVTPPAVTNVLKAVLTQKYGKLKKKFKKTKNKTKKKKLKKKLKAYKKRINAL